MNYYDWFAGLLPRLLIVLAVVLSVLVLLSLIRWIYSLAYVLRRPVRLLELTPPARGNLAPEATGKLLLSLSSLQSARRFHERLLGIQEPVSLEIVSTRSGGIRYLVYCPERHVQTIEHMVASYLAEVKVKTVEDYVNAPKQGRQRVFEFTQKAHFAYPLQSFDYLDNSDPISYITNAMTKLKDGELMSYQLVFKPVKSREIDGLVKQLLSNTDLKPQLIKRKVKLGWLRWIGQAISTLLFSITDVFSSVYYSQGSSYHYPSNYARGRDLEHKQQVAKGVRPVRQLSYFEQQLMDTIHTKLEQPMFAVDIRVLIDVSTKQELRNRCKNIEAALGLYTVPEYQRLSLRTAKHHIMQSYAQWGFARRLPSLLPAHRNLLAASELASLYHFPHTRTAKTENVVKSLSRSLPAPVSLKGRNKLDILIGENHYQGTTTPIGLTEAERERHMYIIGGTGNGKTTMILYQMVQDIQNGKGVAVVDPHGDLAEKLLRYIPKERTKDVIYMNPDDLAYPIGMNLLELTPGISGDDLLREKDIVTEATISVLRKIFSEDDSGGHRIEYVLRNAIQTALVLEEPTLFTIFKLLNDPKFRRAATKKLDDQNLIDFWQNELGKAGEMQKVKMAAGITSKIGRFLFSASARQVLEQPRSTIDFDDILAQRKILICNFSKGLLGDDTSALFGTTVLAKIQTAALRRARLKNAERTPYYLYVDEFQNFATSSFVQMLSEARKYKLFLTMAEQSTSQQDQQRLVDIILANVGTVVCFRSGSPADERLVLPLFSPFIDQGEIANLPSFTFYARIAAVQSQEPMSGMTVLLADEGSEEVAAKVLESSRKLYAKKREPVKQGEQALKPEVKQSPAKRKPDKQPTPKQDELLKTSGVG